jgi:hypothetical protein
LEPLFNQKFSQFPAKTGIKYFKKAERQPTVTMFFFTINHVLDRHCMASLDTYHSGFGGFFQ